MATEADRLARMEANIDVIILQTSELRRSIEEIRATSATHNAEFRQFMGSVEQRFENYDRNISRFYEENNFGGLPKRVNEVEKQMERIKPVVAAMTALIAALITAIGKALGL